MTSVYLTQLNTHCNIKLIAAQIPPTVRSLTVSPIRRTAVFIISDTTILSTLSAESPVVPSLVHISSEASAHTSSAPPTNRPNSTFTAPTLPQFAGGTVELIHAGVAVLSGAIRFVELL